MVDLYTLLTDELLYSIIKGSTEPTVFGVFTKEGIVAQVEKPSVSAKPVLKLPEVILAEVDGIKIVDEDFRNALQRCEVVVDEEGTWP